jgi:hypothetical protein
MRGRQNMRRPRTRLLQYADGQPLVPPLRDPALTLRRRLLVNSLFKYVEEIRNLDAGYALRFCRSHTQEDLEALIGTIADYIIFESRNAPQLTFEIVGESSDKVFWLQVRGLKPDQPDITSTPILPNSGVPSLA